MTDYVLRFFIGGLAVSGFAILGDILRPKSFAGLFGAAPSIALTTLAMAAASRGLSYASIEARSMIVGAIALWVYSVGVCWLVQRGKRSALAATAIMVVGWVGFAFGLRWLILGTDA
jgi:hypothetical protein